MKEIRLLPEQLLSRPSVQQVSMLWVDSISYIVFWYTVYLKVLWSCVASVDGAFCDVHFKCRMENSFQDILEYEKSDPDEPSVLKKYVNFNLIL